LAECQSHQQKTTLPGFRGFRQRTASRAVIKDNFVFVLVKNPLGCSYDEHIDSATCQSQNLSLANCYFACHSTFTADSGEAGARIRNRENGKTKWFLSGLLANRRCLECRLTAVVMGSVSAVSEA
jgi:hypothetical protein